jgi:alcohol dehydrogenase (cytochrome c)
MLLVGTAAASTMCRHSKAAASSHAVTQRKRSGRPIDIRTGNIAWELAQPGPGTTRGGVLATAGEIVFFYADSDAFMAADAVTGKPLWHFQANHFWRASPMTYVFDGKQYVAVASGPNILAFALPD